MGSTVYGKDKLFVRDLVDARSVLRSLADTGRLKVTTVRTLYKT